MQSYFIGISVFNPSSICVGFVHSDISTDMWLLIFWKLLQISSEPRCLTNLSASVRLIFPCLMSVIHKRDELGFSLSTFHAGSSDSECVTAISFSASLAKPSMETLLHQAEEHWLRESLIKEATGRRWASLLPATLGGRLSQNQWGPATARKSLAMIKQDRVRVVKEERGKKAEVGPSHQRCWCQNVKCVIP